MPIPGREAAGPGAFGAAAWWFPVIGLALGAILVAVNRALAPIFPPMLTAALVLTAWKGLTGAIHLDGLADCLDGLGGADVERRLAIMRDGGVGVFGVAGLIGAILIGVAALAEMPAGPRAPILLLTPAVGRLAPLLVGAGLGAATPGSGIGAEFLAGMPRRAAAVHLVIVLALAGVLLGAPGMVVVAAALAVACACCALFAARLGGVTGDVLGAGVELSELGCLLGACSLAHLGLIR